MPTPADLRHAVDDLHTLAAADLRGLWAQVTTAAEAREALQDVLPDLTRTYASASAAVAADWYDELRDQLSIEGHFTAIVADLDGLGADVLARWGAGPLFGPEPDWRRARVLVDGGLQLRIANAARETIRESSLADPQAFGWQRVAAGGCSFCLMLASRGAVFSEATANFGAHDHCRCHAVPAFRGRPVPVQPYKPSTRNISDADRARVREWIAGHDAG